MDYFDRLANKIKSKLKNIASSLKAYFRKLLLPL